jgi:tryptophanyl-tRNA synthetase
MIRALAPIRERALELQAEPERVDRILAEGASTARRMASETMREVRERMGFLQADRRAGGQTDRKLLDDTDRLPV